MWTKWSTYPPLSRIAPELNRRGFENLQRSHGIPRAMRIKWPKAEIDRWDLAAKGDPAADSSHLPGRVGAAPQNKDEQNRTN